MHPRAYVFATLVLLSSALALAVPQFPPQLHTISYSDNSVNYTTLLWLDTQRGVSRVDSINYDDSFPQRLTDMFMCMDGHFVTYNIIFGSPKADPSNVVSCQAHNYSRTSDCRSVFLERAGGEAGIAVIVGGINPNSTCNCGSPATTTADATCTCSVSHRVSQPCKGVDYTRWKVQPSSDGYVVPVAYSASQAVKVEGFCENAGASESWAHAMEVSDSAVVKAVQGLVTAMPSGTCTFV